MISMEKQYRTRDGRQVLIYAIHDCGPKPVHGAFKTDNGYWGPMCWAQNGRTTDDDRNRTFDLIEVRPKITRTYWLAHTIACGGSPYSTAYCFEDEKYARLWAGSPHGRTILGITGPHTIEFAEGDGL